MDFPNCQISTATPAQPGELPTELVQKRYHKGPVPILVEKGMAYSPEGR